ncbi:hypothetical protein WDJ51_09650 [Rathayibacter sp. YIM 133350]|uniref:hypothetical protein n=1 Tax=Rathayibacter sp. YIM 133350 TaxID=3131992 RepID=UPI00307FBAF4
MFTIKVQLLEVHCAKTESDLSSDKFLLTGAILTNGDKAPFVMDSYVRINDGESRDLSKYSWTLKSPDRSVTFALSGWDIDENDSWTNEGTQYAYAAIATAISGTVGAVATPVAGVAVGLVAAFAHGMIDAFTAWDKNDHLFDYTETVSFGGMFFADREYEKTVTPNFRGSGAIADVNYSLTIKIHCSEDSDVPQPQPDFPQLYRWANKMAGYEGFIGAFPTNITKRHQDGSLWVDCVCFTAEHATWRDVPARQLGNVPLNDFVAHMITTHTYAAQNGFRVGFPTYFGAEYEERVYGAILLPESSVVVQDVSRAGELNNIPVDDIGQRLQQVSDYATRNGYVGGYPTMQNATYNGNEVFGVILVKPGCAEVRSYAIYEPPK